MAMIVDIGQMVDLAISTPEAGAVNFNVLNALLHIIVKQVKLNECRIELEDHPCGQIDNLLPLVNQKVQISEYTVTEDPDDVQFINRFPKESTKDDVSVKSIIVVRKKSASTDHQDDMPVELPDTIDFNEDENFSEGSIEPEETQSTTNIAIVDSFVSERLDAAESSIQQINNKVNDISKDCSRVSSTIEAALDERMSMMKDQLDDIEQKIYTASVSQLIPVPARLRPKSIVSPNRLPAPCKCNSSELEKVKGDMDYIKMALQRIAMCSGMKDIANYLNKDISKISCPDIADLVLNDENNEETIQFVRELERKMDVFDRLSVAAEKRLFGLESDFSDIRDRIEDILQSSEARSGETNDFPAVYETINDVSKKAVLALEHCSGLFVSRDTIINDLQELVGKTEKFEESKMDRFEVEELLAEKADLIMVHRKVSTDHFDAVTRGFNVGIIEALEKINEQALTLSKGLQEMDSKIDNKLDKSDFSVMIDEINKKIGLIQERLRALSVVQRDSEAAGIRSKYLRDEACLSCQKPVIMKTQESNGFVPKSRGMISSTSNKAQLSYELDAVRRQMGKMPNGRDMHHFEKMMVGTSKQPKGNNGRSCLRFYGGSHTLISAEDKFNKTHFERPASSSLQKAMQVDSYVKGQDGAMYRVQLGDKCECATTPKRNIIPDVVVNNVVNVPVAVSAAQSSATAITISQTQIPISAASTTEVPAITISQTQLPISDAPADQTSQTQIPISAASTTEVPAITILQTEIPISAASTNEAPAITISQTQLPISDAPADQTSVALESTSGDPAITEAISQIPISTPTQLEEPQVDTNSVTHVSSAAEP